MIIRGLELEDQLIQTNLGRILDVDDRRCSVGDIFSDFTPSVASFFMFFQRKKDRLHAMFIKWKFLPLKIRIKSTKLTIWMVYFVLGLAPRIEK